ncbi:predicted protein [Arabidopsis lyrata subsp. lyrata]|uniref:Predicted protein n=1 Tax=Arabidopsis lyrata subsp. lyrata TaxID=81972 RepID=D7MXC1_ARALL|nr:predicted protein [Arabidopsis lyrata subsp. lyrata]
MQLWCEEDAPAQTRSHFPCTPSSSVTSLFQRSTCSSPLGKFQLLDSDSEEDHPSTSRGLSLVTRTYVSSSKGQLSVERKTKRKECVD